ncbi:tandem-95 repeat protein [Fulvivirga sp. M361]|uniref:MBG domain-containing protein n=1 Tax=Fulvivirga sp. M361 TaxID=2594266 RepID=UPI00117BB3A8|nr:MBG domain-containing protein [Fulvivirga sp. M361]TRX60101.1 tandem-95 repeat protein [Fulvivirga sp. M361]
MARITNFLLVFVTVSVLCSSIVQAQTPPVFDSTPVDIGTFNDSYTYSIETSDGIENDTRTISLTGTLPTGLTFNDNLDGTALISGTIAQTGTFPLTLTVQETVDGSQMASQNFNLVVGKATASIVLSSLTQTYDGTPKSAVATTTPVGLTVDFLYNGVATVPTNAGSYSVIATINDANYEGTDNGTLTIDKATAGIVLSSLTQTYDGTPKSVVATTTPVGLAVDFLYNGIATVPTNAGSYPVIATINDANYEGTNNGTLLINKATASIALSTLTQTYDGTPKSVTATTTPVGLTVDVLYNGVATVPTNAGSYPVIATINDANYEGTNNGTLVINKATAGIALSSLTQTYDGTPKSAVATTTPVGLAVDFLYNGGVTVPTNAGSYPIIATINDANYEGTNNGTLLINKATAGIALSSLTQTYDGTPKSVTATTTPLGLTVDFLYNGVATVPTNAGSYPVIATINDANYEGTNNGTLLINKATASIALSSLTQTYDGTPKSVTATTTPAGLTVDFLYNGAATVPTNAGSYPVIVTINDVNYEGTGNGTLTINKAIATVTLNNLNQNFDGAPKPINTQTTPVGLTVDITYDGSSTVPSAQGSYAISAIINDQNYEGATSGTLHINGPPTSPGIPDVNALEDAANVVIDLYPLFDDLEDADADLVLSIESNDNTILFQSVDLPTNILTLDFAPDTFGDATIVVRATDLGGLFLDESLQISIESVNDAPSFTKGLDIAVNEDAGLQEITGWATNLSAGGGTAENTQTLSFETSVSSTTGNLSFANDPEVDADGNLSFRAALNTNGTAIVEVRIMDSGAGISPNVNQSPIQTFEIRVIEVNDAPTFTRGIDPNINEDAPLQTIAWATDITPGGGSDEAGQGVRFELTQSGISGTLGFTQLPGINNSGTLTFQVAPNTNGEATYSVVAIDDGGNTFPDDNESNPVTLTITVDAVNDPPSFTKGSDITINEDAGTQLVNLWATNIFRGGGDDEQIQSLSFTTNVRINSGNLSFDQGPDISPTGQLSFTTSENAFGVAEVEVTLLDGGSDVAPNMNQSAPQTFFITVNPIQDAPAFTSTAVTAAVQGQLYEYFIEANDPDPSDVLTISSPIALPAWLTLESTANGMSRLFGTPGNGDIGKAGIVLRVTDNNSNESTQFFDIDVINSNDPPRFTSVPITSATEGIGYTYNITTDDDDPDEELLITAPGLPDWLLLTNGTNGNGVLSGIPGNDDVGVNTIKLRVRDNAGAFVDQDFDIIVENTNDPPIFITSPVTAVDEDDLYSYEIRTEDPDTGNELEIKALSKPDWLTLTDNGNGTGLLTGTPQNKDVGQTSVVLNVSDNIGANVNQNFDIVVTNTNDPPSFTTSPITAALQGVEYNYAISSSDPDIGDGGTITAPVLPDWLSFTNNDNGTATLNGTPSNEDFGENPVTLRVTDLNAAFVEQRFVINVDNTNDPPKFESVPVTSGQEDSPYTYTIITSDPDPNDTRIITGLSVPDWLTLSETVNGRAVLSGTPTNDEVGSFSIVLTVTDALGASANQNFTLTITNTNDAPFFTSAPVTAAFQDVTYSYTVQASDIDNGDEIVISPIPNSIPEWLTFSVTGSGTALLTGIPTNSNLGANSVGLRVTDESNAFVDQRFDIIVNNANDPPSFTSTPVLSVTEDELYVYDIVAEDPDEGDGLNIRALVLPDWLTLNNISNGKAQLIGTPLNENVGLSNVVLNVEDASDASANQNFAIQVINTNDPPSFSSDPVTGAIQNVLYSYTIVTSDPDLDDTRQIVAFDIPSWLNLVDNGNGTAVLSGTPTNSNLGINPVRIDVIDESMASVSQSFDINVDNINDVPAFSSTPVTSALEDNLYTYNITTTDPDLLDRRTISLLSGPDWITLEDFEDGSALLSGTPLNENVGTSTIVINVRDAIGANVNQNFTITISNTNDAPEFTSVPVPVALQDIVYTYNITAIDQDPEDEIIIRAVTLPNWLNFNYNGNGSATLQGTPGNSNLGLNDVTLEVEDLSGAAVEQIFQINVDNANDPPSFTSIAPTEIDEDDLYTYLIDTDDPDDKDVAKITALSKPAWLTLVDNGDGTALLSGTPENDDVGTSSVVLNVADGIGANVNQNFDIVVTNTNDAPFFTSEPRTGAIQGVNYQYDITTNDIDPGDNLRLEVVEKPGWITFVDDGNGQGTLEGTPSNSDSGPNSVTMRITDASDASVDQVFVINVNDTNDPPFFTSSPPLLIDEDDEYVYNVATKDPDDGDTRRITALSLPSWLELTDNLDGTAVLQGIPVNDDVGVHSVVLQVKDAFDAEIGQSFNVTVVNVNDPPSFTSDPVLNAAQDEPYLYNIVTSDPDIGDALTIEATTLPEWLTFTNNPGTLSLSGTPRNSDAGEHNVVLRVEDREGAAVEQLFTIDVGDANDAPVFDSTPVITATEDLLYEYLIVTSDEDVKDTRTIRGLSVPDWLTLTDNGDGTGKLSGIPENSNVGSHPIVLRVTDFAGAEANQDFSITVENVNDDPVFTSTPLTSAQQDLEYTYNITWLDPDKDDTYIIQATVLPSWLTLQDNGDGTAVLFGVPSNENLGAHQVTIVIEDAAEATDTQSFSITADNINDPPVFESTPITSIQEDALYQYNVEVTDPDVGDDLTLVSISIPAWLTFEVSEDVNGSGALTGTPSNADVGFHDIRLQVTDIRGQSVFQDFRIEVVNTNDAPVIISTPVLQAAEDFEYNYKLVVTDDDTGFGDIVSIQFMETLPTWLSYSAADTSLTGTPLNDDVGIYPIAIRVTDDEGAFDEQNFSITVINTNDVPVFTSTPVTAVNEDEAYSYAIEVNDVDVGDILSITSPALPAWLTLTDNNDGTATLFGTPENEHVGMVEITIQASDDVVTQQQIFTIEVANVNDAPIFVSQPTPKVAIGDEYSYEITVNDPDVADEVTIEATVLPPFLSFSSLGGGRATIKGTITDLAFSNKSISITATDRDGAVTTQSFDLIINTVPVIQDINVTLLEDEVYRFGQEFVLNYTDGDADPLEQIIVTQLPSNGQLSYNGNIVTINDPIILTNQQAPDLSYIPNPDFNGTDQFTWNGFDGTSFAASTALVILTVESVNDIPEISTNGDLTTLSYSLGDPGINVVLPADNLRISDVDSRSMYGATIRISENLAAGDRLFLEEDFIDQNLEVDYNADQGTLTIEGKELLGEYENILSKVLFSSAVDNNATILTKEISITVNDSLSTSDPVSRLIDIAEIFPEIAIVNSFTPNGDGVNDTWDFRNLQFYTNIQISIFNQNGLRVFYCSTQDCAWDGTYEGEEMPGGSYFYTILLNNGKREHKGTVTILK